MYQQNIKYKKIMRKLPILSYSKNRRLGFKKLGKKFLRSPCLPSFWPGKVNI